MQTVQTPQPGASQGARGAQPSVAAGTPRRFTAREYERMLEVGILREGERVELLDGEVIAMAAMGVSHAMRLNRLARSLARQLPDDFIVGSQTPILLNDQSEPEPDLSVFRDRAYTTHPTPADILLVVEIADSSLAFDRDRKFPRYAEAGIPEAWLFDVATSVLERHTEPHAGRYRAVAAARPGAALPSTTIPGLTLAVDAIVGEGA